MSKLTVVVIGGGIAGISCIEALLEEYDVKNPQFMRLFLISENNLVKKVVDYELTGRQLEQFNISEVDVNELGVNVPVGSKPRILNYTKRGLCPEVDDRVIVIRDTTSIQNLQSKLKDCKRCVIVGNGGISLELVSKVSNCEKIWLLKDEFVGSTFFDSGAARFLLNNLNQNSGKYKAVGRESYVATELNTDNAGPSLGPGWSEGINLIGNSVEKHKLEILYQDEVEDIINMVDEPYKLKVYTKNKRELVCDMVMSAIGVEPSNISIENGTLDVSPIDGGILVDEQMRTSESNIYACGDVISCDNWQNSELWFQKRLWTQARQMGFYAGRCIVSHIRQDDPTIYFNFDCFTHCTSFFGYKLVLLGRYNGQGLELNNKYNVIVRANANIDYVKLIISIDSGRIVGAVLIGDSGLEETIENLIHDGTDVSRFKEHLLDNTVDIEDYFD